MPGKGVNGRFGRGKFWLGSHRYAIERGQDTQETKARAKALELDAKGFCLRIPPAIL